LSALITISIINQLGIKSSHLKAACTLARYMRDWFGKRMRDVRVPRIRRGVQRHAHGRGAAGEQRARGGTGMSARARAHTLEGVGEGHHVEASDRA
jgi:hypothetical protein